MLISDYFSKNSFTIISGTNSKNSIFDDPKIYADVPNENDFERIWNENNWKIHVEAYRYLFIVRFSRLIRRHPKYEFLYQLRVINKHHLKKERIRREVGTICYYREIPTLYKPYDVWFEPRHNQFNFQVIGYAIIEDNGLRKLNFEDKNVYGKSTTVLTSGGRLEVLKHTVNKGAPLLAKYIDKKKPNPKLKCSNEFFQVFNGVHVQLKKEEIRSFLKFAFKFQVLNVKRHCEHQLIWRDDFGFSEKRKFKMACKLNLNILMNQVLRNVKSVKELAKLASIAIKMESMDTNFSELLIAKMYQF